MTHARPDPEQLKMYSYNVFTQLSGAVTAAMIHLGDRMGLYGVLAAADEPLSTAELAELAGLDERWVREWTFNQASARLIVADTSTSPDRFSLSPEGVAVLADQDSVAFGMGMFHRFPTLIAGLDHMPESFRTGLGHPYDSAGPEGAIGVERSFEPWNRHHLLPTVLPAVSGLVERLEDGAGLIDIGCGAGGALLMMAEAFPASSFIGYDISRHALDRAEARRLESGLSNVRFVDPRDEPIPSDGSIDVVTTFDCIHDMTHPQEMMNSIRQAVADDGVWLLVDIKGRDDFAENLEKNPMAPLMYGISVLTCMSSALSASDGAGLGTLGLPEGVARSMSQTAGFTHFEPLPIEHTINAFYEIRP